MSTATASKAATIPLGEVTRFIRGITFKPEDRVDPGTEGSAVCMRTKNVQADLDQDDLIAVPTEFVKREEQFIKETDILVSTANSWELVGKCSWVPSLPYVATAGGFISILRANPRRIYPRYLYYWFSSDSTQHQVRHCGRQTTNISNMSYERCLALEIPLPPLSEQKRIADILDKAGAVRCKRQEAIDLADKLSASAFLEIFGDPAVNPYDWPQKPFSEVAQVLGGFAFKSGWFQQQGTKVVRIGDISDGFVNTENAVAIDNDEHNVSDAYRARAGDVLMALSGATTGKTGIVLPGDDQVFVNQRIAIIRAQSPQLQSFIIFLLLDQRLLQRLLGTAGGSAQENLSPRILAATEIGMPSQKALSRFHSVREGLTRLRTEELKRGATQSDDLFHSLVQCAFQGEL